MAENPVAKAKQYFEQQRQAILADPAHVKCRPEILPAMLQTYLVEAAAKEGHRAGQLLEKSPSVMITCDDRVAGPSLIQEFTQMEVTLLEEKDNAVVMLRDGRRPITSTNSPETAAALERFQAHGGHYLEMELEWLADINALYRLRRIVDEGGLTYQADDQGSQAPVTSDHVAEFMCTDFESGLIERLLDSLLGSPVNSARVGQ